MILTFKVKTGSGQIEISDIIMKEIVKIVDGKNSLYDSLDDFFLSALRKEVILNLRGQFSKEFMKRFKDFQQE